MDMNKYRKQSGFSLLELVVVVAVLGTVTALATDYVVDDASQKQLSGNKVRSNSVYQAILGGNVSTINGEIDLTMHNTTLVAETMHGQIYADEKLKFTLTNRHVGQKLVGRFDNPTNRLRLNTINGNMYLR